MPDYALSPLTWAMLMALLLAVSWRRLPSAWRVAGVTIEVLLLLSIAPIGANLLVWSVESQSPTPRVCADPVPTTIVVLSGGTHRFPRSPDDYSALDATSLHRLFAGITLWRRTPGSKLVIVGGGRGVPEAVLLGNLAARMGVPRTAMELEVRSRTTWENALNLAGLSPKMPRHVWLVTSALHMPRALGAFRAWGFEPCAWPAESLYQAFYPNLGYFVPQQSSLHKADLAIHELIGGLVYRGVEWKHQRTTGARTMNPTSAATVGALPGGS